MVRLWLLGGKFLLKGKARSSGEAAALAAVAVIEGQQRPLARRRRRPQARRPHFAETLEERYAENRSDRGERELPGAVPLRHRAIVSHPGRAGELVPLAWFW